MSKSFVGIAVLTIIIIATIVYGFMVVGSPADARNAKFDQERVSDIQQIRSAITSYTSKNNKLPDSIDDTKEFFYGIGVNEDPETKQPYEYQKIDNAHFKLCATFGTDASQRPESQIYTQDAVTLHTTGYQCFDYQDQILNNQYYPSPYPYASQQPYYYDTSTSSAATPIR
jgi:hypothetical protein